MAGAFAGAFFATLFVAAAFVAALFFVAAFVAALFFAAPGVTSEGGRQWLAAASTALRWCDVGLCGSLNQASKAVVPKRLPIFWPLSHCGSVTRARRTKRWYG